MNTTPPRQVPDIAFYGAFLKNLDLPTIAAYIMPEVPLLPSDVGFLFGTRHGVEAFCEATHALWVRGMFRTLIVSGGVTTGDRRADPGWLSSCLVNYFGVALDCWHEHVEFRIRVLAEYEKIPGYLERGFLQELAGYAAYPSIRGMT